MATTSNEINKGIESIKESALNSRPISAKKIGANNPKVNPETRP
jgi:hypothetical protein